MDQEQLDQLKKTQLKTVKKKTSDKTLNDLANVEKRLKESLAIFDDKLSSSIMQIQESHTQNYMQIQQCLTSFCEADLGSKTHQLEQEVESIIEHAKRFENYKIKRHLIWFVSYILGLGLATTISAWMYTDHLRQYQDPLFLQYAHLGKSLVDGWSQLTQKERDKITNLSTQKKELPKQ